MTTTVAPIWWPVPDRGGSPSQPPTMLSVLTQTAAFVSGNWSEGYGDPDVPTKMAPLWCFPGCPDRQRRLSHLDVRWQVGRDSTFPIGPSNQALRTCCPALLESERSVSMSQVLRMRNQTSLSRTRGFAEAMIQQTLQTCLCPCGDAELDQTARAIIGNKIRRSLEIAWQAKLRPSRLAWLRLSAGAQGRLAIRYAELAD